jgi:hypothetical protein
MENPNDPFPVFSAVPRPTAPQDTDRGKSNTLRKICANATLSTINSTQTGPIEPKYAILLNDMWQFSSYLTQNKFRVHYEDMSVNTVKGCDRYLLCAQNKYIVGELQSYRMFCNGMKKVTTGFWESVIFHKQGLNVCLFSWRYNPLWLYFHSPVAGFSLLVFEVSWSHTTTRHSR